MNKRKELKAKILVPLKDDELGKVLEVFFSQYWGIRCSSWRKRITYQYSFIPYLTCSVDRLSTNPRFEKSYHLKPHMIPEKNYGITTWLSTSSNPIRPCWTRLPATWRKCADCAIPWLQPTRIGRFTSDDQGQRLQQTPSLEYKIELRDTSPFKSKPDNLASVLEKIARRQIQKYMDACFYVRRGSE